MKVTNSLFLIISMAITLFLFPSGKFVDSRPNMINYFFIGYFIWMGVSGIFYYFINFFLIKNKIYSAFWVYISMVSIICIILGVIKGVAGTDTISVLLWFINLLAFAVLGSLGFWISRLVTIFFCK